MRTGNSDTQDLAAGAVRVGGQAVIEGVMMRAGDSACVAIRRSDGVIETRQLANPGWAAATATVPLLRGLGALAESLTIGVNALRWSELRSAKGEATHRRPAPVWVLMTIAVAAVLAMVVVIPAVVAGLFPPDSPWFGAAETATRLGVAGGYLAAVARRGDVRRVFEYHGAEHLAVAAHEAGRDLTPESARLGSIHHPRCGTSFLIVISVVAAAVHPFLPAEPFSTRLVARVVIVPLIVAVAYEVLTFLGRVAVDQPGGRIEALLLWPQRFTTRRPDDAQIEVAIAALTGALDANNAPAGARALIATAS